MTARLFDTHLLLWAAARDPRLPRRAAVLMSIQGDRRLFSPLSIAEVAIKFAKGRPDFTFEPDALREGLVASGYEELPLTGRHAVNLLRLGRRHGDPFDRLIVAQALTEGVPLVTADRLLAGYPGQVIVV